MRKNMIAVTAAVLCGVILLSFMATVIYSGREAVQITQTVSEGDGSAVEGLVIHTALEHENQMFWEMDYRPGQTPSLKTDFTFLQWEKEWEYEVTFSGLRIEHGLHNGGWGSMIDDLDRENAEGLDAAFLELYEEALLEKPGTEVKKTIYLKDYYDYYPVGFEWDYPSIPLASGGYLGLTPRENTEAYNEIADVYGEFFKIPVLENEVLELHMTLREGGLINNYGHGGAYSEDPDAYDSFYLYTIDPVLTADAGYFTIEKRTNNGQEVDTSQIPGGWGIYCQPYTVGPDGNSVIDPTQVYMAYPLSRDVRVLSMHLSPDEKDILLHTWEKDAYYLTVIETGSMKTKQRLLVTTYGEGIGWSIYAAKDNFMTVTIGWDQIAVLERQPNGTYLHRFTVDLEEDLRLYGAGYRGTPDFAFDGIRLAMTDHKTENRRYSTLLDHYVAVFTAEGMQYYGEYQSSFSPAFPEERSSIYMDTLDVEWE